MNNNLKNVISTTIVFEPKQKRINDNIRIQCSKYLYEYLSLVERIF